MTAFAAVGAAALAATWAHGQTATPSPTPDLRMATVTETVQTTKRVQIATLRAEITACERAIVDVNRKLQAELQRLRDLLAQAIQNAEPMPTPKPTKTMRPTATPRATPTPAPSPTRRIFRTPR